MSHHNDTGSARKSEELEVKIPASMIGSIFKSPTQVVIAPFSCPVVPHRHESLFYSQNNHVFAAQPIF